MFYSGWSYFGRQAVACGKGPTTFATSRALASERIVGGTAAKKGAWPFMVNLNSFENNESRFILILLFMHWSLSNIRYNIWIV